LENAPDLKRRILEEMTVNYSTNLERSFDLAKQFIRLLPEGTVEILVKYNATGKEQILLYLIGKMYAKEAGYVSDESVNNNELLQQLGLPVGSLLPFLKELRDQNLIRQMKRDNNVHHAVPPAKVQDVLNSVGRKLARKQTSPLDNPRPKKTESSSAPRTNTPKGKAETSLILHRLQESLVPEGYFRKPRNTNEVRLELESRFNIKFLSRKVSQALGILYSRSILSRVGAKRDFRYVIEI